MTIVRERARQEEPGLGATNTSCEFSEGGRNNPSARFASRWSRSGRQDARVPWGRENLSCCYLGHPGDGLSAEAGRLTLSSGPRCRSLCRDFLLLEL